MYSEKAPKFCKIFPLLLTVCTAVKGKGKILQNFVAFSEYMNFSIIVEIFSTGLAAQIAQKLGRILLMQDWVSIYIGVAAQL